MTFKEKLQKEHPGCVSKHHAGGCIGCPASYGYETIADSGCLMQSNDVSDERCTACWNRTIPGTEPKFEIFGTRYLGRWIRKNPPLLTENAKNMIKEKIYLTHSDVEKATDYDLQRLIYTTLLNAAYGRPKTGIPDIKKVIFNDPATIVIWADGEKTVVKCQNGEPYDPEKGLAMAISKRALGNKHEYYNTFKHWLKKYNPNGKALTIDIGITAEEAVEGIKKMNESFKKHMRGCVDT